VVREWHKHHSRLIVLMSFRLAIPRRVVLQQSPLPLRQSESLCDKVVFPVESFSSNGKQCLNCLSQPRGPPQTYAYGDGFSKLAARLASGSHVLVQGEIVTREYEPVIKVPNGKKTIERKIQQQVVEIKANIIRVLGRSSNNESDAGEPETEDSGAETQ
jgi:hypothetical protein